MSKELRVEVISDRHLPEGWIVDAIGVDGEGAIDTTTFVGLDPEGRAREYANWKYNLPLSEAAVA